MFSAVQAQTLHLKNPYWPKVCFLCLSCTKIETLMFKKPTSLWTLGVMLGGFWIIVIRLFCRCALGMLDGEFHFNGALFIVL